MIKSLLHFNNPSNFLYDEVGNTWQSFGDCSSTTQGKFHNALSLSRGYIQNNTINLDFTSDWTLDFWVYNTNSFVGQPILSINSDAGTVTGFVFEGNSLYVASKSSSWYRSKLAISANQWIHIALVHNNQQFLFFVNGVKITDISTTNILLGKTNDIIVGCRTGGNSSFVGFIDEFRVTDKAEWISNFTPPITEYNSKALYIGADNSVMGMV